MIHLLLLALQFTPLAHPQTFNYLQEDSVQIAQVLPPPSTISSPEGKADLAQVLQAQSIRTEEACARARTEIPRNLTSFYGAPYGPLTNEEIQNANDLVARVLVDAEYFADKGKALFNRPRPFVADSGEVHPCSDFVLPVNGSYPSGHALDSHLMASVMSLIYPERKGILEKRSTQIANDRVIAGVHYPSDLEAGRKLAEAIMSALAKNPAFEADLAQHLPQSSQAK